MEINISGIDSVGAISHHVDWANLSLLLCLHVLLPTDVVIAPPSCYLSYVKERVPPNIEVSAQNCYKVAAGAYTGEIRYYPGHTQGNYY